MADMAVEAHGIMDGATYVFRHIYSSLQNQKTRYDHDRLHHYDCCCIRPISSHVAAS